MNGTSANERMTQNPSLATKTNYRRFAKTSTTANNMAQMPILVNDI
jgi:hypothetical protein